ncbi:MAG: arylsulfatase [Planctomycetota bacterium]
MRKADIVSRIVKWNSWCWRGLATVLAVCLLSAVSSGQEAPRPNVVLIMCDDMGFSDLGCYGGEIRTPNIDRLAKEGLRFTQFYNCAKCTTTRASVVTGLHPRQGRGGLLRDNMVTIAEVLAEAGYHTSLSGKWHLGSSAPRRPIDRGFQEYYGLMDGCCNFFNPAQPDPPYKGGRVRVFGHNARLIKEFPDDYYTTDAFSDHAAATIRRFARAGEPFFVHVCYTAPHYPLHAKPDDIARYRGKYQMGWHELRRIRHARQLDMGLLDPQWKLAPDDPKAGPWEGIDKQPLWELRMAVYAAMIDAMDQGVGRILGALEETETAEDTLVMFLSDNGGCSELPEGAGFPHPAGPKQHYTSCGPGWGWAQNTPFRRYKSWVHEGGIATPLIARWPGVIQANTMTNQVGHVVDFMPTCVELAGARYPETFRGKEILPVEGKSLVPVFRGRPRQPHETISWYWAGNRAIRQGKWKLVWEKSARRWELYDLEADRTELDDLADRHPERVAEMSRLWLAWAEKTGVSVGGSAKKGR